MGNGFSVGGADDPISFCKSDICKPCFSDPSPCPNSKRFKPKNKTELMNAIREALKEDSTGVDASYQGSYICNWDTSKITNMSNLFEDKAVFNADISRWNTSQVTSMSAMFYKAIKFNQKLNWDTSKVENMSWMFQYASDFNQKLNWDVSQVEKMSGMFNGAENFDKDISDWDVSNVEDMSSMFDGAKNFNRDISGWKVKNVENMSSMFNGAEKFNQNLRGWDVSNVTNMSNMFNGAKEFSKRNVLILKYWNINRNTKVVVTDMFNGTKGETDIKKDKDNYINDIISTRGSNWFDKFWLYCNKIFDSTEYDNLVDNCNEIDIRHDDFSNYEGVKNRCIKYYTFNKDENKYYRCGFNTDIQPDFEHNNNKLECQNESHCRIPY